MRFFRLYFLFIFCGIIHNGISQENINFLYKLKVATSKSDSIKVLIYLSEEYRFSTPEKGLETSILAYELSLELKDTVLMILSSNKKAQLQNGNSLENLALGSIIKSLYWAKKIKNDNLLANTRLIAGHVYRSLKDTDKSLSNYKDALGYFLYVNDSIGISSTYSGMGKVYYDLGNNIKALDQYLLSERYWIDSLTSLKANLWNNIGAVYIELEDFDDAKKYFEKALLIYFNQEWYAEMSMIYCNLGELELYRRNFDLSLDFYNNSLKIGHKINSPTEVMWANEGLYRNKRQSGNLKSALINFENYIRIRDSLSNAQNLNEVRELEVKYEQDQNLLKIKEQEIELYQNKVNVHYQKQQNFIFAGVSFLILILFGIGILFYYRTSKKNSLLESQKQMISKSLFEKEILLKEIHHRVKNNMQVISSLLNLQKNTTDNKAVEYVISETQNRIQAIALVHQKLYQSKDIEAVNFEGYLTELIDLQMDIFQNKKIPLDLVVDVPETVKIKLDLAISLGLIVSEIITNAFKYAFTEIDKPRLVVKLYEVNETEFELNIKDNGPGVPEGFFKAENESLGKELMEVLTEQINGKMNYKFEGGASFYIKFPA